MVVKSALNAYKKIKEKDKKGEEPMYRPKTWNKARREKEKKHTRKQTGSTRKEKKQ